MSLGIEIGSKKVYISKYVLDHYPEVIKEIQNPMTLSDNDPNIISPKSETDHPRMDPKKTIKRYVRYIRYTR